MNHRCGACQQGLQHGRPNQVKAGFIPKRHGHRTGGQHGDKVRGQGLQLLHPYGDASNGGGRLHGECLVCEWLSQSIDEYFLLVLSINEK
jgi:hypothetical protein